MRKRGLGTAQVTRAGMRLLAAHPTETVWRVFVASVQYMDPHLQMAPGHQQIADDVGRTVRSVCRAFNYLVGAGVLAVVHRGNQHRATRYAIGPLLQARLRANGRASAQDTYKSGAKAAAADIQMSGAKQ